jgi:hypothetical protein
LEKILTGSDPSLLKNTILNLLEGTEEELVNSYSIVNASAEI